MRKKLVVIGGGAAGFFCAINAAQQNPDLEVTILEKTSKILTKVKVSGGGRCNVTHACFSIADMIRKYPRGERFLKHAFHLFFTTDTIRWFEERNIQLKTENDGRMFPKSNSSETIVNCLLTEAKSAGVKLFLNREVTELSISSSGQESLANSGNCVFSIKAKGGEVFHADYICIASGGHQRSESFRWLLDTGHTIENPVSSLFTFNLRQNSINQLQGISFTNVVVKIKATKYKETGPLLITHWGLSGPAILKLSAYAARVLADLNYDFTIVVNWCPSLNENDALEKLRFIREEIPAQKIINRNPFNLPDRFWNYMIDSCGISEHMRWADLPAKNRNLLAKQLCSQEFQISGKTTFKEEFVTAGGINLSEVDPGTMESKIVPNLFFAGEVLNVDGVTGGYNFQHAWTSGWVCARTITQYLLKEKQHR